MEDGGGDEEEDEEGGGGWRGKGMRKSGGMSWIGNLGKSTLSTG